MCRCSDGGAGLDVAFHTNTLLVERVVVASNQGIAHFPSGSRACDFCRSITAFASCLEVLEEGLAGINTTADGNDPVVQPFCANDNLTFIVSLFWRSAKADIEGWALPCEGKLL